MRPDPLDLLRARVPLVLLMDLLAPNGPDSAWLLRAERPDDLDWLPPYDGSTLTAAGAAAPAD
jgi:hypothetical protein